MARPGGVNLKPHREQGSHTLMRRGVALLGEKALHRIFSLSCSSHWTGGRPTRPSLSLSPSCSPPNQQHGGGEIASDGSLDNRLLLLTRGGRGAIAQLSFCQRTTLRSGFQRGWPTTWGCGLQPEGQDFTGCGFRKTVGNRSYLIMLIMATP